MKFKNTLLVVLCFCCQLLHGQVDNSVLRSGNWYKIGVLKKGIHKIDRAFLEGAGINTANIDPRNIALYGNGGNGMLPQSNFITRPEDLTENRIMVHGETDGSFDTDDYILFYGNSPDLINYDSDNDIFSYEKNLYSDTTFYFLTIKETTGLRIENRESLGVDLQKVDHFRDLYVHETDATNLIRGGRIWFGEDFTTSRPDRTIEFDISNITTNSDILLTASLMAQGFLDTSFDLELNGTDVGSVAINDVPDRTYVSKGDLQTKEFIIGTSSLNDISQGLNVGLHYNSATSGPSIGFINYLTIEVERQLALDNNELHFYNTSGLSTASLEISNSSSDLNIWDVSESTVPINQLYEPQNNQKAVFGIGRDNKEFVAFAGAEFTSPILLGQISNQNLHGLASADALFITHRNFLTATNTLKTHRESMISGFNVHVVTVDQIYNEFSSGAQDVSAIRDFIKYIYDKDPSRLKYALLFGDCSYDYKDRSITQTNFVPVYEARNSLHPLYNFSSDDYFGFMEDHEGEWVEDESGDHTLEIGIGRLPVKTSVEASDMVSKIVRYETSQNAFGDWRNEMLFIADDGDNNIHQRDANILATYVEDTRNEFNINKLYIDAFEQVSSPSGQSSPSARKAFEDAVSEGKLMINYTGHGNEAQLTVEKIIDENQISGLDNRNRLPFFITATCEFGNYDNPDRVSGGEKTILSSKGGAIALLTSTRPVFSNTNFILNEAFYFAAMEKVDGEFPRLGDIIRKTKNNSLEGAKNRNFALLGDPTMRLAYPKYELAITSVNGKIVEMADTLKALTKIQMGGEVRNPDKSVVAGFNGIVSIVAFDKPIEFSTLGNENTTPQKFSQREALLFKGDATVEDGYFSFEFVVPKNISYVFGDGKISMYAISNDNMPLDANGSNIDLKVGGSNPTAIEDTTPPEINLFMNDASFVTGQTTGPNPLFLAELYDESGINISNQGFGQDISISINDGDKIIINEFYSAHLDTYQNGLVSYPLNDLEPGRYTISFTAYDTYNNSSQSDIDFIVTEGAELKLSDIAAYPNPLRSFHEDISITFTHDRQGEELLVLFQIINLQGRVILENNYRFDDSSTQTNIISWDGKNTSGNSLQKGIYIYKLIVQSTSDGAKNQAHRKLVIF